MMPPSHRMPPVMMGSIIYHCKTHLNIESIHVQYFFENIGHKYDFEGGWGGPW